MRRAELVLLASALIIAAACDPEAQVEKAAARSGIPVRRNQDQQANQTAAAAVQQPKPVSPQYVCKYLTDSEASRVLGQTVTAEFSPDPNQCAFKMEGAGHPFTITINNDTAGFYELTAATGAQMVDAGDRAVWLNNALHVISGRRRVIIQMAEGFGSADVMLQNAKAIARAVIANL